jgi:hypothetical protein
MGMHDRGAMSAQDFGPVKTMTVCVHAETFQELTVFQETERELAQYGLRLDLRYLGPWERPGFTYHSIYAGLLALPRPAGCHKLFALMRQTAGDYAWALLGLPTVYGVAGGTTEYDRAYAVLDAGHVNHEVHHLLGCTEHFNLAGCYPIIADFKRSLP